MWKPILNYPPYEANEEGQIRHGVTGHIKQVFVHPDNGYHHVHIHVGNRKVQLKRVHQLVAQAWIPNPENKETINHKNGDKSDNSLSNLEWMTHAENIEHAFENGLASIPRKAVVQYDKKGNYVATYISLNEAARAVGGSQGHISKVCQGKRKTHKKFVWRYEEDGFINTDVE